MAGKILRAAVLLAAFSLAAGCASQKLTEAERSDPGIKARLEAQLRADRSLDLKYVTVDVHAGVVTVSGLVPSWENKRDIETHARRLEGIEQAIVNLAIQE